MIAKELYLRNNFKIPEEKIPPQQERGNYINNMKLSQLFLFGIIFISTVFLVACGQQQNAINPPVQPEQLQSSILNKVGGIVQPVKCSDPLPAKIGATTQCILGPSSKSFNVDIKVTAINAGEAQYDIKIASMPNPQ
jgi:hypothetical protein